MNKFKILILILIITMISCQKKITNPKIGEIVEAIYGLGSVESESVFIAKSAISTSVKEFYVREGNDVVKGQKLFMLDEGAIIKAPFDGRITEILVSVKENLFPQSVILTLINLKQLFLSVTLEQQGAMRIKKNIKAEISFEFFRNTKIIGTVETIYPQKNAFVAKVKIEKWPEGVLPGMTADVAFEIDRKKEVVLIPANSITNGNIIFKRDGNKRKLPVKIGLMDSEYVEVIEPKLLTSDEIILP
ncbi:MAG: HlyD family efflux transporter periplasmic adaptor subunit [Bacteriovoracaceae bacterium]